MKHILLFIFLVLELAPNNSSATTTIAFMEFRNSENQLVPLEPNGRFGHVAISFKNGWIHAYPPRNVEWVESLEGFGRLAAMIEIELPQHIDKDFLTQQLNKKTDVFAEWEDESKTYCSKLVGQFLQIDPKLNNWSSEIWNQRKERIRSEIIPSDSDTSLKLSEYGLSPDDIYEYLLKSPYLRKWRLYQKFSCQALLELKERQR